jgi:hypothetical protein
LLPPRSAARKTKDQQPGGGEIECTREAHGLSPLM